ncbi:MAG: type II secretion system F family protein [Desulfuromonadaceae bacterium]
MFDYIIAGLAAISAGILAWLFFQSMYHKLAYYRDVVEDITTSKFSELFLFVDVSRYFYFYIGVITITPLVVLELSRDLLLALIMFVMLLLSPFIILKLMIKKRMQKFERQLPDALLMLSGSLRAGASVPIALDSLIKESPAPLSQEFSLMVREQKLGLDLETTVRNMERRIPLESLSMSLSAILISREVGGDLAQTLESLADTLRRKLTMEGKIQSLTAQGKLQGVVMSALPLFLMLVLLKLEPEAMGMMFTTRMGWAVLFLILCMQTLGFIAIRKITRIDV